MRARLTALALAAALCVILVINHSRTATTGGPTAAVAQLDTLPRALRAQGQALLEQRDARQRARLAEELSRGNPEEASEFLLAVLAADPSPQVRSAIVGRLGRHASPQVRQALAQRVSADPDAHVALRALERLRVQSARELAALLEQRVEQARATSDEAILRQLAPEHERWISLVRGTMLPAFLRAAPPVFAAKGEGQPIRVLAFGDFGNGSKEQRQVAAAMLAFHRQTPVDFAITLGDNFYNHGMESLADPRWKTWWDELYDPLGVKVYAVLGNHDWDFVDSPAAEILYTKESPSWRMPAPYYTFTAGPAQFFALDTTEISEAQLLWLKDALGRSRARWKVVYGHHPIYSVGAHQDNPGLIKRLWPVVRRNADAYLAGHDHDLQHLKAIDGVHFFVAGGGGAGLHGFKPEPRALFAREAHAFCVVEADGARLRVRFIDTSLSELYEASLTKTGAVATLAVTRNRP